MHAGGHIPIYIHENACFRAQVGVQPQKSHRAELWVLLAEDTGYHEIYDGALDGGRRLRKRAQAALGWIQPGHS